MGAVFAIFGGFYYWIEKMTGLKYNEQQGQVHFIIMFIGANITFFPMHFLGLAGMPRRIPDYKDAYTFWNQIASIGSFITFAGVLWFFYVLYTIFSNVEITPTTNSKNFNNSNIGDYNDFSEREFKNYVLGHNDKKKPKRRSIVPLEIEEMDKEWEIK
jgi:heme/copper-type cytochrome/quinol oxidase subunit 1